MASTPSARGSSGAAQDRLVGRILGDRYRVLSRLGEGGMGTVYLCEHAVLSRRYAVKVLRPNLTDPELAERFRNEAIAASRIGGDNVVDVLDFGAEDDGALYYVMEALEGRSLGTLIAEEGPLEILRALELLEQICGALAAAHARGVVHRDVKPDNVFVVLRPDGTEQVKVIDFGVSQVAPQDGRERITRAGAIMGTPEYMAPEQASGDPVDHRADVYALGVLAYELLTGTLPIVALTPVATLVAHQTRTPEAPSRRRKTVPPEVDALVLRALAKRPEDRPPTMEAFAAEIAQIRGAAGARPVTTAPAARTLVRPRETVALSEGALHPHRGARPRLAAVGFGAAVVVAVAGVVGWWGLRATPTPTPTSTSTSTSTATATPNLSPAARALAAW
jgi:serine/threonine-protein kinase